MQQLLKDLRSALELQHAIQGTLVPLGDEERALDPAPVRAIHESPQQESPQQEKKNLNHPDPAPVRAIHESPQQESPQKEKKNLSHPDPAPVRAIHESPQQESPQQDTVNPNAPMNTDLFGNQIDPSTDTSLSPYKRIAGLIAPDSPLHNMHSLEEVESYVANTVLMPLDETRLNPVFGVGNPDSNLMVIGEAPGADEDQQGEPFVGRAGQLLNKILAAINFQREEVYIANILKSRPPNNRDPQPGEVAAHIPVLYKQIALIKPKIILCVGKTAGNNLLKRNSSLSSMRGKFNDFYGLPVMVTYHPAALLRNPQWKRPTWEDVQLLRARYDEQVAA